MKEQNTISIHCPRRFWKTGVFICIYTTKFPQNVSLVLSIQLGRAAESSG